ncbi:hypothetical protein ACWERV_17215 [Streptomyces sp. NPDC004031]
MNIPIALTGAALALAAVAAVLFAVLWAGREHRRTPAPLPAAPRPVADAYLPCHTARCGHMSTAHDRTEAGLVCRGCGTTREEAPGV